ncbi:hypothetical protein HDA32_004395 [Spinactinospora alkalitolerans]|uniref:Uncharacterized protein n=1 Tax=Spinactinospora alkalitolerans TaxID=687207 RepID=A0A852U160_9ACTN|nr:DUF6098 family protein [Spinactinospora alkalitolerans]NYE49275.1 hypothetical protein [Spinactinospora alkalitolerans]
MSGAEDEYGASERPRDEGGDAPRLPVLRGLDELVELIEGRRGLYLRYSHGPAHDSGSLSLDYESGLELPGLSATVLDPEPWWRRPLADWLARQVCKYAGIAEEGESRRAWILAGRVTARGPDHEPLLVDVDPVAWLDGAVIREAHARYEQRFDVGRDSTR